MIIKQAEERGNVFRNMQITEQKMQEMIKNLEEKEKQVQEQALKLNELEKENNKLR